MHENASAGLLFTCVEELTFTGGVPWLDFMCIPLVQAGVHGGLVRMLRCLQRLPGSCCCVLGSFLRIHLQIPLTRLSTPGFFCQCTHSLPFALHICCNKLHWPSRAAAAAHDSAGGLIFWLPLPWT